MSSNFNREIKILTDFNLHLEMFNSSNEFILYVCKQTVVSLPWAGFFLRNPQHLQKTATTVKLCEIRCLRIWPYRNEKRLFEV